MRLGYWVIRPDSELFSITVWVYCFLTLKKKKTYSFNIYHNGIYVYSNNKRTGKKPSKDPFCKKLIFGSIKQLNKIN